ncbi:MAG: hypothetical protein ACO3FE_06240 [Planctomycetaceae bacterium]
MSLREQFALDCAAILNTDELGEAATWTKVSGGSLTRCVRLIEQPDRQTIRRANVWTPIETTRVSVGDLFTVKRGAVTTVWRVMYTDPAETAIQRSYCHLQLTDTVTLRKRKTAQTQSMAERQVVDTQTSGIRCQWFTSSAEIETSQAGRRRGIVGEFYLILQELLDVGVGDTITDSDGLAYRVERVEQQFNRVDLPYLICRRSDA